MGIEIARPYPLGIYVATSITPGRFRGMATYQGDGTADDVEIAAALAEIGGEADDEHGGPVTLLPGKFTIAAQINWPNRFGVTLQGSGRRWSSTAGLKGGPSIFAATGLNTDMFLIDAVPKY